MEAARPDVGGTHRGGLSERDRHGRRSGRSGRLPLNAAIDRCVGSLMAPSRLRRRYAFHFHDGHARVATSRRQIGSRKMLGSPVTCAEDCDRLTTAAREKTSAVAFVHRGLPHGSGGPPVLSFGRALRETLMEDEHAHPELDEACMPECRFELPEVRLEERQEYGVRGGAGHRSPTTRGGKGRRDMPTGSPAPQGPREFKPRTASGHHRR